MDVDEVRAMIGHPLGPTDWWDVDQHLIDRFAALTGDTHWMHVDPVRAARESGYGGTIAPGLLTLLVVPRFAAELTGVARVSTMVLNYGLNRVRFPAPVLADSRLRGTAIVMSVDEVPGGIQPVIEVTVEIEGGTRPACVAEMVLRCLI